MDNTSSLKIINNIVSGLYSIDVQEKNIAYPVNNNNRVQWIAIGSDHGGYDVKEALKVFLREKQSVDYPDYAFKVAKKVASGECERGIMIDGAGIGSSMVCNKVKGIRAALCYDKKTIVNSREHNNANVLTLGGPLHILDDLKEMVKIWLDTPFAGGRHWKRINKMMAIERDQHTYRV